MITAMIAMIPQHCVHVYTSTIHHIAHGFLNIKQVRVNRLAPDAVACVSGGEATCICSVLYTADLFLTGEAFIPGINGPIGEVVHKFFGIVLPRYRFTTAQATLK